MKHPRTSIALLGTAFVLCAALTACGSSSGDGAAAQGGERVEVATVQLAQVGVLDENVAAFKEELRKLGIEVEFKDSNAQGQISNVSTIVNQLSNDPPDLAYVVGTPLVVAAVQKMPRTPIVFGIMNDPVGAKVARSLEAPGGLATGTSGAVPAHITFDLIAKTIPDAKRVGLIGNPSEANTQNEIRHMKAEAGKRGIELVVRPVINTGEVASAVRSLKGADALIVPSDNTVVSAISTVAQTARELKLPTFDPGGADLADQGILYAYGPNYKELGREAARQAASILRDGKSPGEIPVAGLRSGSQLELNVNETTAKAIGATVPAEVRSQVAKVVK